MRWQIQKSACNEQILIACFRGSQETIKCLEWIDELENGGLFRKNG